MTNLIYLRSLNNAMSTVGHVPSCPNDQTVTARGRLVRVPPDKTRAVSRCVPDRSRPGSDVTLCTLAAWQLGSGSFSFFWQERNFCA